MKKWILSTDVCFVPTFDTDAPHHTVVIEGMMPGDRRVAALTGQVGAPDDRDSAELAQLFSSAPDLLESLSELATWCENWMPTEAMEQGAHEALLAARAALSKAAPA